MFTLTLVVCLKKLKLVILNWIVPKSFRGFLSRKTVEK